MKQNREYIHVSLSKQGSLWSRTETPPVGYEFVTLTTSVCNRTHNRDQYSSMYCRASSEMSDAAVAVRPNCSSAQHSTVTHSLHKHLAWPLQFCFLHFCKCDTLELLPMCKLGSNVRLTVMWSLCDLTSLSPPQSRGSGGVVWSGVPHHSLPVHPCPLPPHLPHQLTVLLWGSRGWHDNAAFFRMLKEYLYLFLHK